MPRRLIRTKAKRGRDYDEKQVLGLPQQLETATDQLLRGLAAKELRTIKRNRKKNTINFATQIFGPQPALHTLPVSPMSSLPGVADTSFPTASGTLGEVIDINTSEFVKKRIEAEVLRRQSLDARKYGHYPQGFGTTSSTASCTLSSPPPHKRLRRGSQGVCHGA